MFKLLLGRAGSGKTTAVLKRLCQEGKERPQVLLVPEQQSHETERALCKVGGPQINLRAEVLSFSRLANRIFQAAGGLGEEELDAGGRLLLMHRAVRGAAPGLRVYGRPSKRPAFLSALIATADELKSCCVPPEVLVRAGEDSPGAEGDKLRDLGLILGEYQALTEQTALDPRDRLTRAADKLRTCRWGEGMDFWLDGFTDFTPQQGELLRLLMGRAGAVCPKGEILDRLWGGAEDNNLEAYISFLRKKFFYLGSRASIATLRKVGYRLDDPDRPA